MSSRPEGSLAVNLEVARFVDTRRQVVDAATSDFTDVSAVVIAAEDLSNGIVSRLQVTGFDVPLFVVAGPEGQVDLGTHGVTGVLASDEQNAEFFGRMVETSAANYDATVLPPFFGALSRYERRGYSPFDCPGHQGGQFFMRHPAGRRFVEFLGENPFRADLCNADVTLGGLLNHEGPALAAEKHAAKVFHSDESDVVLFDRNNHKSIHHGATPDGFSRPRPGARRGRSEHSRGGQVMTPRAGDEQVVD